MKAIFVTAILVMSAALTAAQSTNKTAGTDPAPATNLVKSAGASNPSALAPANPAALEPEASGEPHTEMLDLANTIEHDPLLEAQPLPHANLSLIGGIVRKVDPVHNRILLQPFGGGGKYLINFDDRTRILSVGRETTSAAIHPGDRVYADTQALGPMVFARTIQLRPVGGPAQASGQVIEILAGQVSLQDRLSGQTMRFAVSDQTKVEERGKAASLGELHSGSLIDVTFIPSRQRSEAQSITIHASPGESYVFAGILTHVDLSDGVLALDNQPDGNNYELYFDPLAEKSAGKLVVGTPVSVTASFDGKRYRATSIHVTETASDR